MFACIILTLPTPLPLLTTKLTMNRATSSSWVTHHFPTSSEFVQPNLREKELVIPFGQKVNTIQKSSHYYNTLIHKLLLKRFLYKNYNKLNIAAIVIQN